MAAVRPAGPAPIITISYGVMVYFPFLRITILLSSIKQDFYNHIHDGRHVDGFFIKKREKRGI
jgi:hypothetical protein